MNVNHLFNKNKMEESSVTGEKQAKQKPLAERFNKYQLTSLLATKDQSRLGYVQKMATVPLLNVLENQLNS